MSQLGVSVRVRSRFIVSLVATIGWISGVAAQPVLLDTPTQVAVDAQGNVFVIEPGQRRIARFDATGNLLGRFGSSGTGPGQFASVTDVTIDPAGNVLVLDRTAKAVLVFSNVGTFMSRWQVFPSGSPVSPNAIVATTGRVFVSGSEGAIYAYSLAGQFLSGRPVITGQSGMDTPGDLAIDASGNLYAVDRANNRILRFGTSGPDSDPLVWGGWIGGCSSGSLCQAVPNSNAPSRTTGWCKDFAQCGDPRVGVGKGRFTAPVFVSAATNGAINVSDIGTGVIQRFSPAGAYIGDLAPRGRMPGETGTDATAVAPNGDILAVQTRLGRVSRFSAAGTFSGVFGGGVELSVFPGDTAVNPLRYTVPATFTTTVGVISLGGHSGPLTLASTSCIGPRGVPAVSCSTLGITTSFANPTVNVSASPAAVPMGIAVTPATPDGMTLVIVQNAISRIRLSIAASRKIMQAQTLTLLPGGAPEAPRKGRPH